MRLPDEPDPPLDQRRTGDRYNCPPDFHYALFLTRSEGVVSSYPGGWDKPGGYLS